MIFELFSEFYLGHLLQMYIATKQPRLPHGKPDRSPFENRDDPSQVLFRMRKCNNLFFWQILDDNDGEHDISSFILKGDQLSTDSVVTRRSI